MSITLQCSPGATGLTVYAVIFDDPAVSAQVWNPFTPGFEAFSQGSWSSYAVALQETAAGSRLYRKAWDPPRSGRFPVQFYQQLGNSPDANDAPIRTVELATDGTGEASSGDTSDAADAASTGAIVDQHSVVGLCNIALGRVGSLSLITSLDEDSNEARACNLYYPSTRDRLLRDFAWPFATKIVQPALVEKDPAPQWGYSYRYPPDALMVRRIVIAGDRCGTQRPPFALAGNDAGRLILCDVEDVQIAYTAKMTNPAQFDPLFSSVLAWLLASEIAMPLTLEESKRDVALKMFERELSKAQAVAANEATPAPPPDSEFITARY